MDIPTIPDTDVSRRDMLRRSALVGGSLVWATPVVQSLASPAFAAGSVAEEPPAQNGYPSYVFVFFKRRLADGRFAYYQVKYGQDEVAQGNCRATRQNVSADQGFGPDYYDDVVELLGIGGAGQPQFQTPGTCPPGVVASTDAAGDLVLDLPPDTKIIGWLLHDGSCKPGLGGKLDKFRMAPTAASPTLGFDPQNVGPAVPTSFDGTFLFSKCK